MEQLKIAGRKPVREALEARLPLKTIFLAPGAGGKIIERITRLAEKARVPVKTIPRANVQRMAGGENDQGIIAVMDAIPTLDLHDLLAQVASKPAPAFALLDGVEDPHNFGAVLRVADAAGLDGVVVPRRRSASLTPGTLKASAGAAFHVPVAEVGNLARAIETLKKHKFWLVGADQGAAPLPWEIELHNAPVAFVLGSEARGLHRIIREKCDFLVALPMLGRVESLNVSTAAAALFYERVRQLGAGGKKTGTG